MLDKVRSFVAGSRPVTSMYAAMGLRIVRNGRIVASPVDKGIWKPCRGAEAYRHVVTPSTLFVVLRIEFASANHVDSAMCMASVLVGRGIDKCCWVSWWTLVALLWGSGPSLVDAWVRDR